MARILLGVSAGIAAYKALELVRLATADGHAVRVVQTPDSQRFVGAASFAALTGAPVLTGEFERDPARGAFPDQAPPAHDPLSHLELVRNADAYVIAPATANTIAKLAHGLADNLLTSAALAARCPLVVAPAMNDAMWANPATVANVATLRARAITVLEPGVGRLASKGEAGAGRLPEPAAILAAVEAVLPAARRRPDRGGGLSSVLVTAGGTREPIDAVRYVGNRSSGRMGLALAEQAAARGARVTVVAANVDAAALVAPGGRRRGDRRAVAGGVRGALRGVRRPADGRRRRRLPPRGRSRVQAQEGSGRSRAGRSSWSARPTSCPVWPRAAATARRSSGSRPRPGRVPSSTDAPSWSARAWTPWWSTTSPRPTPDLTSPRTR